MLCTRSGVSWEEKGQEAREGQRGTGDQSILVWCGVLHLGTTWWYPVDCCPIVCWNDLVCLMLLCDAIIPRCPCPSQLMRIALP